MSDPIDQAPPEPVLFPPPYPGDGHVHACCVGPRAIARCGYPDSNTAVLLEDAPRFVLYPADDQCPACADMVATGTDGPAEWTGG